MEAKFQNVMNEDVRALKDRLEKYTKGHIKKDSTRYFVVRF